MVRYYLLGYQFKVLSYDYVEQLKQLDKNSNKSNVDNQYKFETIKTGVQSLFDNSKVCGQSPVVKSKCPSLLKSAYTRINYCDVAVTSRCSADKVIFR